MGDTIATIFRKEVVFMKWKGITLTCEGANEWLSKNFITMRPVRPGPVISARADILEEFDYARHAYDQGDYSKAYNVFLRVHDLLPNSRLLCLVLLLGNHIFQLIENVRDTNPLGALLLALITGHTVPQHF